MNANSFKRRMIFEFLLNKGTIQRKKYEYINAKDEQLLTIVALAYAKRLSVSDLLNNKVIGSQSSVHSRVIRLLHLKLIEYEKTEDRRRYQVNPTEKLLRNYDQLGNMSATIVKMYLDST